MKISTSFNMYSDARGGDPDATSPTLRRYHQFLWSKSLPGGALFELKEIKGGLYHNSELGEFYLGSDAITHSYKNQVGKQWIVSEIPAEVDELYDAGSTIGAYIIFPNNRIAGSQTINQARGCNSRIDDRFDLTLECIRRMYLGETSPLHTALMKYKYFFDIFGSFKGYVNHFLLEDLIHDHETMEIKFYLPFDGFETNAGFQSIDQYRVYKTEVMNFIRSRNKRIKEYAASFEL